MKRELEEGEIIVDSSDIDIKSENEHDDNGMMPISKPTKSLSSSASKMTPNKKKSTSGANIEESSKSVSLHYTIQRTLRELHQSIYDVSCILILTDFGSLALALILVPMGIKP